MENRECIGISVLILCSIIISMILSGVSSLVGRKQPDFDKVSVYECGFDPLGSSRWPISVNFF